MSKNSFVWREPPKTNPYIAAYFPDMTIKEFTDMYKQIPELEESQRELVNEMEMNKEGVFNAFGQPSRLLGSDASK